MSVLPTVRRGLLAAVVLSAVGLPATAAGWNLDLLMQSLASVRSDRALFTETKRLSLLDRPVESSGELVYFAPHRFEKRTVKPTPELLVLDRDTLRIERGRMKQSFRLEQYPQFAGFVDSIRGVLSGNKALLEKSYRLKLDGGAESWRLALEPTDAQVRTMIHRIDVAGSGNSLHTIEIIQTDGDTSTMTIQRPGTP